MQEGKSQMSSLSVNHQKSQTNTFGYLIPLVVNSILLVYTTMKLILLIKRSNLLKIDQMYGSSRVKIFFLIAGALTSRVICESTAIYEYYTQKNGDDQVESEFNIVFFLFVDNAPLLCFISIASLFVTSWHNHYMSLERDNSFQHKRTKTKYERFLQAFNALIYISFCVLLGLYTVFGTAQELIIMAAMFFVGLITVTILLIKIGRELFTTIIALLNSTGQIIKSSVGFKVIFRLLVFCCFIKSLQQLIIMYSRLNSQNDVISILNFLNIGMRDYNLYFTIYVAVFYLIGESGLFLCLILLLNAMADKSSQLLSASVTTVEQVAISRGPNARKSDSSLSMEDAETRMC